LERHIPQIRTAVTASSPPSRSPRHFDSSRCCSLSRSSPIDRRTLLRWITAGTAAIALPAFAQKESPRYTRIRGSADGIGKSYMGREISGVMGWQGAAWLEREEREQEERGDLLLRELGLKPGMAVADVGAGTGYYARRIAPLVGSSGIVYAVDVQPEMIQMLGDLAKKANLPNIKPVLCTVDNVKLPDASIDLAIMVDVYHELEFPFEVMESVVRALKPGGRVVYVEYRAEDPKVPIKTLHKMSEAQVKKEAAAHALVYERTANTLPWQHVVVFRKR
jgi:SAM-dependent methyltransferase